MTDAESGVASLSLLIDGQDVQNYGGYAGAPPPGGQLSYPGPWSPGAHTWEIQATDNVGNVADVRGSFRPANPPPPLPPGVFIAGQGSFAHHPGRLTLSGSLSFTGLHWSGWSTPQANGQGRELLRSHGKTRSFPAQLQLSEIQVCGGRRVYTHLRYRIRGQSWITAHRKSCRLTP